MADPLDILDGAAPSDEELIVARDAFVEALVEEKRLAKALDKVKERRKQAGERLHTAMADRGVLATRLDNGVLLKRTTTERWSYLAQDIDAVLAATPVTMHTVNQGGKTGGTFAKWVKSIIDTGETAPPFARRTEIKEVSAYNLSRAYPELKA